MRTEWDGELYEQQRSVWRYVGAMDLHRALSHLRSQSPTRHITSRLRREIAAAP